MNSNWPGARLNSFVAHRSWRKGVGLLEEEINVYRWNGLLISMGSGFCQWNIYSPWDQICGTEQQHAFFFSHMSELVKTNRQNVLKFSVGTAEKGNLMLTVCYIKTHFWKHPCNYILLTHCSMKHQVIKPVLKCMGFFQVSVLYPGVLEWVRQLWIIFGTKFQDLILVRCCHSLIYLCPGKQFRYSGEPSLFWRHVYLKMAIKHHIQSYLFHSGFVPKGGLWKEDVKYGFLFKASEEVSSDSWKFTLE